MKRSDTLCRPIVRRTTIRFLLAGALTLLPLPASARDVADTLFLHGTVIPMTAPGATAQGLAVKNGRIMAVGSDAEISLLRGDSTHVVDLQGRTLLPGFIDAHGHIASLAQQIEFAVLAPPPVGGVSDISSLQAALRAAMARKPEGWLIGAGYDDAVMTEKRHPTRQELDAVSADRPVAIVHVSGHLATLNTRALELVGMLHPEADPPGGVIRREADGKTASGVLEERALFAILAALPPPSIDKEVQHLEQAQAIYARNGLTTAQNGAMMPSEWVILQEAARRKKLFIDVDALPMITMPWPGLEALPFNQPYSDHLRIAGVKIIADGSPQGRTAWLSHPYHISPAGKGADYAGYQQIPDIALREKLTMAADNGWQVFVHVNGDQAVQQLIENVRTVGAARGKPMERTIAIHSQTARPDQLKAMKALDIQPSFFASHTFYWGDWYREVVLGPVLGEHISPQREAFNSGLRPTIHNDTPIVPPDMIRLIWSAVTRRTRSNDILGPTERVTPYEALQEVTVNAAWQLHEDNEKGTLEPGKLADLVILSGNPLTIDAEKLLDLKVSATIKEGRFIYEQ